MAAAQVTCTSHRMDLLQRPGLLESGGLAHAVVLDELGAEAEGLGPGKECPAGSSATTDHNRQFKQVGPTKPNGPGRPRGPHQHAKTFAGWMVPESCGMPWDAPGMPG